MKKKKKVITYSYPDNEETSIAMCNYSLISACERDELDGVINCLVGSDMKYHADIHHDNEKALNTACEWGNREIVEYLLFSPELKEHAFIQTSTDSALFYAAQSNRPKLMDFLLNDPRLAGMCDVKHMNSKVLAHACSYGAFLAIQYLVEKTEIDIQASNNLAFRKACKYGHDTIAQYLAPHVSVEQNLLENTLKNTVRNLVKHPFSKQYQNAVIFLLNSISDDMSENIIQWLNQEENSHEAINIWLFKNKLNQELSVKKVLSHTSKI